VAGPGTGAGVGRTAKGRTNRVAGESLPTAGAPEEVDGWIAPVFTVLLLATAAAAGEEMTAEIDLCSVRAATACRFWASCLRAPFGNLLDVTTDAPDVGVAPATTETPLVPPETAALFVVASSPLSATVTPLSSALSRIEPVRLSPDRAWRPVPIALPPMDWRMCFRSARWASRGSVADLEDGFDEVAGFGEFESVDPELVSVGPLACAIPGLETTAKPTPSETASAPTRPT